MLLREQLKSWSHHFYSFSVASAPFRFRGNSMLTLFIYARSRNLLTLFFSPLLGFPFICFFPLPFPLDATHCPLLLLGSLIYFPPSPGSFHGWY